MGQGEAALASFETVSFHFSLLFLFPLFILLSSIFFIFLAIILG